MREGKGKTQSEKKKNNNNKKLRDTRTLNEVRQQTSVTCVE